MNNTLNKEKSSLKPILKRLCDPVLIYTVLIVMSIMYHYRSSMTIFYGILTVVLGVAIFRIFDFISRHRIIGIPVYLALGVLFIFGIRLAIDLGSIDYPISFMLWFITPQDAVDYNSGFTFAIYLLFTFFMASVVYYFNIVRYRIFMNFLIFIIPFAIYGKEYEKMPTLFILLLAVGYIVMMIRYRQLTESNDLQILNKKSIWSTIAVYSAIFASAAAIIPKPDIEANRDYLDMLIDADAFTERLVGALNVFKDTTESNAFNSQRDDSILYYCQAYEPLRLKTTTYTSYDFATDNWSVETCDRRYAQTGDWKNFAFSETGTLMRNIAESFENDPSIAKKYGLEEFSLDDVTYPREAVLEIEMSSGYAQYMPVPTLLSGISRFDTPADAVVLRSGQIYSGDSWFTAEDRFKFRYSTDTFFDNERNKELADMLCIDDYWEMLEECSEISETREISNSLYSYSFIDEYLDYGDNKKLAELSEKITGGFDSDYDKACALEQYFIEEGFIYDLEFKKEKGANVNTFLFEDKRGVCYEFASAMVMLARASGIPARFAEGYNMSERSEDNPYIFLVRSSHAHAFPELYIRGVGWMSFEPTVPSDIQLNTGRGSASRRLTQAGIFILCITLLMLFSLKLSPIVSHRIFLMRVSKKTANQKVVMSILRIRKLCGVTPAVTSDEMTRQLVQRLNIDISASAALFDSIVYGNHNVADIDGDAAVNCCIKVYERLKDKKSKRLNVTHKA